MTREEKVAHWGGVLERWRSGGQNQAQFCRENNLSLRLLRYWLRRERRRQAEQAVAEFAPVALSAGAGSGLWLRLGSGAELRIEPGFDEATLRRVLGCLPSC
jgi:hypothetical protein